MVAALEGFGAGRPKGSRRGRGAAEQRSLRSGHHHMPLWTLIFQTVQWEDGGGQGGGRGICGGRRRSWRAGRPHPPFPRAGVVVGPWGAIRLPLCPAAPHHFREHPGPFPPIGPVLASCSELRLPSLWPLVQPASAPSRTLSALPPCRAVVAPGCPHRGDHDGELFGVQWATEDVGGQGLPP